jgi:hypothetical protein
MTCTRKLIIIKNEIEKAYDQVEWPFIIPMFKALGIGSSFIGAVEILFVEGSSSLSINR